MSGPRPVRAHRGTQLHTLGWPQDTTALEEGCITDDQFLDLCQSIFDSRKKVFYHHLASMLPRNLFRPP